jgi:hypothetical protein
MSTRTQELVKTREEFDAKAEQKRSLSGRVGFVIVLPDVTQT